MAFVVMAVPMLAVAPAAMASQYQQDGYHYYPGIDGPGHWVDDRCSPSGFAFDIAFYGSSHFTGEATEICGQEDDLGLVPYGPPFQRSNGSWDHNNLDNRIKSVEAFADPSKCVKLFPGINKTGTVVKLLAAAGPKRYSAPDDFPAATTSSIGSGTC